MKIDSLLNKPLSSLINTESQTANADAKAQTPQVVPEQTQEAAKKDTVSLSDRSRLIARATEIVQNSPDVRVEKVDELKARISAGTYNVSGQTVAESMIKKGFLV